MTKNQPPRPLFGVFYDPTVWGMNHDWPFAWFVAEHDALLFLEALKKEEQSYFEVREIDV